MIDEVVGYGVTGSLPPLLLAALAAMVALVLDRAVVHTRRTLAPRLTNAAYPWLVAASLAARAAVWLGIGWLAGELHPSLETARSFVRVVGYTLITAPVFMLNKRGWSILDVVEAPLLALAAWLLVRTVTRALDRRLVRVHAVAPGTRNTIVLLARCALAFSCALILLLLWGVDVTSLTVTAGVLGVGLGFGLQNVTSNFVSGLLVSLERPIQPGDFIRIGDRTGMVERIGMRCTEIVTLDRVSILIPNASLLEQEVVNWSHGDPVYRLHVPVGVAYGSDPAAVRAALLEAAASHPAVLAEPAARVEFVAFGASALEFELLVWAADPKQQARLLSDMNFRVEASLRRNALSVPFPQRDVHLHSPVIERLADAWARRQEAASEAPAGAPSANGHDGSPATRAGTLPAMTDEDANRYAALAGAFDDAHHTSQWTDQQLDALITRMRGDYGLSLADRRYRLTVYPRCFVGREAVDWMVRVLGITRSQAVEIGRRLSARGTIHHVLDAHPFRDANLYYRFRADEQPGAS